MEKYKSVAKVEKEKEGSPRERRSNRKFSRALQPAWHRGAARTTRAREGGSEREREKGARERERGKRERRAEGQKVIEKEGATKRGQLRRETGRERKRQAEPSEHSRKEFFFFFLPFPPAVPGLGVGARGAAVSTEGWQEQIASAG